MTKKSPSRLYRDTLPIGHPHRRIARLEKKAPRAARRNEWHAIHPGRLHRDLKRLHQDLLRTAP